MIAENDFKVPWDDEEGPHHSSSELSFSPRPIKAATHLAVIMGGHTYAGPSWWRTTWRYGETGMGDGRNDWIAAAVRNYWSCCCEDVWSAMIAAQV